MRATGPWEREIVTNAVEVRNGYIPVPETPGLGIDLNLDEIRRHPYQLENALPLFKRGWERRRTAPGGQEQFEAAPDLVS